ncbi:MAG: type II secretion system protein [Patescibacteria group bacterium]
MLRKNRQKGFTLLEVIVYIALLTFIIGSGVVAAFYVIDASEGGKADINAIAEAEFLLRKIDWVLIAADNVNLTEVGVMKIYRTGFPDKKIDLASDRAQITIGVGTDFLTNDRVKITNLVFTFIPPNPPKPAGVTTNFLANGQPFSMTKYLRK